MYNDIIEYNNSIDEKELCNTLFKLINENLKNAQAKIWHAHPVWFINDNPIVGYSKQKKGIRLMFWSGADFEESILNVKGGKYKDASVFYNSVNEISKKGLTRCLKKAESIQWDYKNLIKRKGKLEKLVIR
ncbi:MAG: DUF1801 domain-containing protein [Bacteroidetes bacterium]|nr:DUF1801 domain-containing protein [Bacteroidota bacterium]